MSRLVLFEDDRCGWFEPVALTRSVARLRLGAWTHRERWERLFPERDLAVRCRAAVAAVERECGEWAAVNDPAPEDTLFVNAALGRPGAVLERIRGLAPGDALVSEGRLLAARAEGDVAVRLAGTIGEWIGDELMPTGEADCVAVATAADLTVRDAEAALPETLADLMAGTGDAIVEDFETYRVLIPEPDPAAHPGVHFVAADQIRLAEGVRIEPGCVLDASDGPILLGPDCVVEALSHLRGPVVLGAGSIVRAGGRLGEGVSLGPVCRLGGEVHGTIVQGFSNKQHDGFLGHSYLGSWVNLGAATDTSDLKNNYGTVRLALAGAEIDSGRLSVGSLVGDHTKTAIHTSLNTGTVLGVSSNVFGAGFPPKRVPSFRWGGSEGLAEYRLDKAVALARTVMGRRSRVLGPAEEALLARIHAETRD